MHQLKAVLFDLDDTLYTMVGVHDRAIGAMRSYACNTFGLEPERFDVLFKRAQADCIAQMLPNATSHSRLIWAHRFCEELGCNPLPHAAKMEQCYWDTFLGQIALKEGAAACLEYLRSHGIHTALCTDMQMHIQYRKVEILGLQDLLDTMVCSDMSGYDKPHPSIYCQALQRLGCRPCEALMVGDSLKKDVYGPQAVGIEGIWFNDLQADEQGVKAPIVHSFAELQQLLESRIEGRE